MKTHRVQEVLEKVIPKKILDCESCKEPQPKQPDKPQQTEKQLQQKWYESLIGSMKAVEPEFVVDDKNANILLNMYFWVWSRYGGWSVGPYNPQKGLLFFGPIGTGKTTLLRGLQHYLNKVEKARYGYVHTAHQEPISFAIHTATEIALEYTAKGAESITRLVEGDHLAIDEIGRELQSKHFGTACNTIQTVLQLRYELRHKYITLGTTNIDMQKSEFAEIYGEYILDRAKEMFNVIRVGDESRRHN